MKAILLSLGLLLSVNLLFAQALKPLPEAERYVYQSRGMPAAPSFVDFPQPDGSSVTIQLFGDAVVNWAETTDGYALLRNTENCYEYAMLDDRFDLVSSGIQAQNPQNRTPKGEEFLSTCKKDLKYSVEQVAAKIAAHQFFSSKGDRSKAFPTIGTPKLLVILANFNNTSTSYDLGDFESYMNAPNYGGKGCVKDFYFESSYEQLELQIVVTDWVTLPNNHNYYGPQDRWGEFAYDAVVAADPFVDFSEFDNDGDNTVDGISIIHQGIGQEVSGSGTDIWSHSWNLSSAGYSASQRMFDGVKVDAYTAQPELGGYGGSMNTIGVMCHEFGHNLGAPDFYDTDYGTGGSYSGTGNWDLQASGSYNGSPSGSRPSPPNDFTKFYYYNWVTPVELTTSQEVTMTNSYENQVLYYYTTPTTNEYYLLANRQQVGFDQSIPGHGLLIYHVDQNWIASHDNSNNVNATAHQGLYPKDAGNDGNINDSDCPYPTPSNDSFTDATSPNSKSWDNEDTEKPIENIEENNGIITFNFSSIIVTCDPPENLAATVVGEEVTLTWDEPQTTGIMGYKVYRDGDYEGLAADPIYIENLAVGTYLYCVETIYTDGCVSPQACLEVVVQMNTLVATIAAEPSCDMGEVTVTSSENIDQQFVLCDELGNELETWTGVAESYVFEQILDGEYRAKVVATSRESELSESVELMNFVTPAITTLAEPSCEFGTIVINSSLNSTQEFMLFDEEGAIVETWSGEADHYTFEGIADGTYYAQVATTNCSTPLSEAVVLTNDMMPTPGFEFVVTDFVVAFTATATGAESYAWEFGDGESSVEENPSHTYAISDAFAVVQTAINGDCSVELTQEVIINNSVATLEELGFSIYPNPAYETLTISSEKSDATLTIYNALGQKVYQSEQPIGDNTTLDISDYEKGLYLLQITFGEKSIISRIVIAN